MILHRFNKAPGGSINPHIAALAEKIDAAAKPGAPYCHSQIALMLAKRGQPSNPLETLMKEAALVCDELLACYGWVRHPAFPFFAKSIERTTTALVLTYAVPPGIGQNITALCRIVQILTGDEPTPATLRRAVSRLIESGVYTRVGEGMYANSYAGD